MEKKIKNLFVNLASLWFEVLPKFSLVAPMKILYFLARNYQTSNQSRKGCGYVCDEDVDVERGDAGSWALQIG